MSYDEMKRLEAEQWDECCRLRELADAAAQLWSKTRQEVKKLEQEAEVNRLVQQRLADAVRP
jgi:hypothetical protein